LVLAKLSVPFNPVVVGIHQGTAKIVISTAGDTESPKPLKNPLKDPADTSHSVDQARKSGDPVLGEHNYF